MQKQTIKKVSGLALGSSMLLMGVIPAASAFAATGPAFISGVNLTANGLTFTANATTKGPLQVEYQYRIEVNNHWYIIHKFTKNDNNLVLQSNTKATAVEAFAMTEYQVAHKQWYTAVASKPVMVSNVGSLSITGAKDESTSAGAEILTVVAKDGMGNVIANPGTVKWSVSPSTGATIAALADGTQAAFTATTGGTYTVTATLDGKTATQTINVYGAPAAVKLTPASSSLVADGAATDTITATVVDANGNTVADYNGNVDVSVSGTDVQLLQAVGSSTVVSSPATYTATNGKVTIPLQVAKAAVAGNVDQVNVSLPGVTGSTQTQDLTIAAQKATYVEFANAPTFASNSAPTDLTLEVTDQNHVVMNTGAYLAAVSLSGEGTLGTTGAAQVTTESVGLGPTGNVSVSPLYDGATGTFTLTPSVSGLIGVPTTVTFAAPGTAVQWGNTSTTATSFTAADGLLGTYTIQSEDANGLPVSVTTQPTAAVTQKGAAVSDLTASVAGSNGTYSVALSGTGNAVAAGTYDLTISGDSLPNLTIPITITAGAATQLEVTPSAANYDVLSSNPYVTVTAQLADQFGNPVATAGQTITFTSNDETLSGGSGSSTSQTVSTSAQGQASVNADVLASGGIVTASSGSLTSASTGKLNLVASYATAVKADITNLPTTNLYTAGAAPTITFTALDSAGNAAYANDVINWTATGPNGYSDSGTVMSGQPATLTAADAAGNYTVTATDVSIPNGPSTTTSFAVEAGSLSGFALFSGGANVDATGATAASVATNSVATFTVSPVDRGGNIVGADADYTVTLPTSGLPANVQWENTSGVPISTVSFTPGQTSQTVMLANGSAGTVTVGTGGTVSAAPSGAVISQTIAATGTTVQAGQSTAVTLTAKDSSGNPLAGETLTLSLPTVDGTLSSTTVTTDSNGQAVVTYVAPSTANSYTLTVTPGALGAAQSIPLTVTADVSAAQNISATETALGANITWSAPSTGTAASYQVWEINNTTGSKTDIAPAVSGSATSYSVTSGLTAGDSYEFNVDAVDQSGNVVFGMPSAAIEYGTAAKSAANTAFTANTSSTAGSATFTVTMDKTLASGQTPTLSDFTVKDTTGSISYTVTGVSVSGNTVTITTTIPSGTVAAASDAVSITASAGALTDAAGAPSAAISQTTTN